MSAPSKVGAVITALIFTLAGCSQDKPPEPVSIGKAAQSDTEAAKACTSLLGDGTGVAKDLMWSRAEPAQLSVKAYADTSTEGVFTCTVEDKADTGTHASLRFANTITALNDRINSVSYHDSETETHVAATNTEQGVGVVAGEIPTQATEALQKTLDTMAGRLRR